MVMHVDLALTTQMLALQGEEGFLPPWPPGLWVTQEAMRRAPECHTGIPSCSGTENHRHPQSPAKKTKPADVLFSFSWHFFPHKSHSLGSIFSTDELHAIFSGSQNPELSTGQWGPHRRKPWAHSALSGPVFTAQHLAFLCQSKSSGGFAHFCRPVVLKPGWTLESRGGNVWKYWSGPCPKPISLGSLGASGGSVITLY